MPLLDLQQKFNSKSSIEELINAFESGANQGLNSTENNVFMYYINGLLNIKMTEKLIKDQNIYNAKILKTNRYLVYANWTLVVVNIILLLITKFNN
ncbi:MAG: hypothetical protein V1667_03720 [bacterium]